MTKFILALLSVHTLSLCCVGLAAEPGSDSSPMARLHFQPPGTVLGDTIPFYWQGTYHVFYLKGSSWGHLSSCDLIHWEQVPDALEKGEGSTSPDGENCWTGSIVEHNGIFHLFYTGKNSADPKGDQKVMMATSQDLIVWTKHPERTFYADGKFYWNKPVNGAIDDKLIYHHQAFRDPEVFWNTAERKWWMLLHAALPDGSSPVFARYVSGDLVHWEPQAPLLVYPKAVSGDCPHLFEMNRRWYLLGADRHYTWSNQVVGPYSPEMLPYEWGELFVPKTLFDGQRRILLGWIGHREGDHDAGQGQWGGVLCMPRELYADAQGHLHERPVQEVIQAFNHPILDLPDGYTPGQRLEVPPDYMLHCRLHPSSPGSRVTLVFRQPQGDPLAGYRLTIDFGSREIGLGGQHTSYKCVADLDESNPVEIRLFVVGTVCECFVNDAYCLTMRIYDYPQGGVSLETPRADVELLDLEVKGWGE